MRSLLLFFLINLIGTGYAETLKDPWVRDEDISRTVVDVDISKNADGLYVYEYTISSNVLNRGTIQFFSIGLLCDKTFPDVALPSTKGDEGFTDIEDIPGYESLKTGGRTPALIYAKFGNAAGHSFTIDNRALWMILASKGDVRTGLKLVSPARPGLRDYLLIPDMEPFGWDYPDEEDPSLPWIDDFTVTGMISAPACHGVTPPVDAAYFPGSRGQGESDSVNSLLTYSKPMVDRWHTDESVNELIITINYADNIDPSSFEVKPEWARAFFEPKPGTSQTVTLPLKEVRNRFKLKVDVDSKKVPAGFGQYFQDLDEFEVRRYLK